MGSLRPCPLPLPLLPPNPPSPPRYLWPRGAPGFSPSVCGGGGVCGFVPLFTPSLLPLSPCLSHLCSTPPLPPRFCRSCCWFAGVWPLVGPPPGGKLTMRSTMDRACSSGFPLPPNGGGATSPTLAPWHSTPLVPPPPPPPRGPGYRNYGRNNLISLSGIWLWIGIFYIEGII